MKIITDVGGFALLACCSFLMAISAHGQSDKIEGLSWLTGCWEIRGQTRQTSEQWMKPAGGTMMGMSRTVRGGKTVEYEFLRIVLEDNGEIFYIAKPSGQSEARFKLVKSAANEAVFENLKHDFPQRIIYRLQSDGVLFARIEGKSKGENRGVDFPMARAKCE